MVGDRYGDIELARNAKLHSAFVLSGYGRGEWEYQRGSWNMEPEVVAENLLEAVENDYRTRWRTSDCLTSSAVFRSASC